MVNFGKVTVGVRKKLSFVFFKLEFWEKLKNWRKRNHDKHDKHYEHNEHGKHDEHDEHDEHGEHGEHGCSED